MLPRNESVIRKLSAENLDQCRAALVWDEPAVPRDFKLIMNLFISTKGCIVKEELNDVIGQKVQVGGLTRTNVALKYESRVPKSPYTAQSAHAFKKSVTYRSTAVCQHLHYV